MRSTPPEKAHIVAEYIRNQSVTEILLWVRTQMRKEPPAHNSIIQWHTILMEDPVQVKKQ